MAGQYLEGRGGRSGTPSCATVPGVEEDRQVRATVGTQGVEKSLTPKMTPVLGGSWGVKFREDQRGLLGGMRR